MRELDTMRRQTEILALNPGLDPDRIREGQVLNMPPRKTAGSHASSATPAPEGAVRVTSGQSGKTYEFKRFSGNLASTRVDDGNAVPAPPSGTVSASPRPGAIYITQSGDKLTSIAKRAYANHEKWTRIYVRNAGQIADPSARLPAGLRLFLPE